MIKAKSIATAALAVLLPLSTSAETNPVMKVVQSDNYIPHVYIHTGGTIDISLPEHETMPHAPVIGDRRWVAVAFMSGQTSHLVLKPQAGEGMDTPQLLTIPSSRKVLHVVVSSGPKESSVYSLEFFAPFTRSVAAARGPAPSVTPAALARVDQPTPAPQPTPRMLAIKSCDALDHRYAWHDESAESVRKKLNTDKAIDIYEACDDGQSHTFLIMREGRNPPGTVPFKVDAGGRQDQIANASFVHAVGEYPDQWVIDGIADRWALVVDSSNGQIRKGIVHLDGVASR